MDRRRLFAVICGVLLLSSCAGTPQQPTPAATTPPAASGPAQGEVPKASPRMPKGDGAAGTQDRSGSRSSPSTGTGSQAGGGKASSAGPAGERAKEPSGGPSVQEEHRTAREHVLEAMKLLDKGEAEGARPELTAALRQEPGNETAASLLKQLDADPEEMLGREHFSYTVQGGDTLSRIAKRFLNDENKFYILARYNGIEVPRDLSAGQMLKIPGRRPPAVPKAAPPTREPPVATPKPAGPAKSPTKEAPARPAEAEAGGDKLYQGGMQALQAGAPDRAYDLFSQVPRSNPKHAAAQEKIREVRPAAVEALYKKAVAAYRRQDLDETIRLCNRALELDPDNEKVKLRRAEALELQEKMKSFK